MDFLIAGACGYLGIQRDVKVRNGNTWLLVPQPSLLAGRQRACGEEDSETLDMRLPELLHLVSRLLPR